MKRFTFFLSVVLSIFFIAGCGDQAGNQVKAKQDLQTFMAKVKKIEAGVYEPMEYSVKLKEYSEEELAKRYGDPKISKSQAEKIIKGIKWETNNDYTRLYDKKAVKGGEIKIGDTSYPATLRTAGENSSYVFNSSLEALVYEPLTGLGVDLDTVPGLADKWAISPDKTTYYFHIDQDAKWQDGKPVVAYDYVATWDLMTDDGLKQPFLSEYYKKFHRPVALSKEVVSIKPVTQQWRLFMAAGGMTVYPEHVIGRMTAEDYMTEFQNKLLVGTGPYIFESAKTNEFITLKRNKNYWSKDESAKHTYNFNRIRFVFYTEQSILIEKLKKGDIDLYQVGMARRWVKDFVPEKMETLKYNHILKQRVYNHKPNGIGGYAFNMREEPFDDIRIRKAIYHLFNREKMMDKLFFNEYKYKDSIFPNSVYENKNNPKIRYDMDAAIELLEEAGWSQDNLNDEGYLVKDGKVFEIELSYTGQDARIETILQEEFRNAGIKLNLKQVTWATSLKERNQRQFKFTSANYTGMIFPNPEGSFHSKYADSLNTNNLYGFKNDRVDELIALYNDEYDVNKRIKYLQEIDYIVSSTVVMAYNWYADNLRVLYWNKFGLPEFVVSRYSYDIKNSALAYWWYDADKAYKLENAKGTTAKLEGAPAEVSFWNEYAAKKNQ